MITISEVWYAFGWIIPIVLGALNDRDKMNVHIANLTTLSAVGLLLGIVMAFGYVFNIFAVLPSAILPIHELIGSVWLYPLSAILQFWVTYPLGVVFAKLMNWTEKNVKF